MTAIPPITSADCPDDWISDVREAAKRSGWPMRCDPIVAMIEFKSDHRKWMPKCLPGGGVLFTSVQERDAVARRLL